ncbi:MAG: Ig-like domain-containing protein [Candidatus Marinimicrobia bacterium]|nr:Ig-like domain-containing protein [Candidatus Neomarinimicrobiota bacterium]
MKKLILFLLLGSAMLNAQVTGLSGWNIFVDPGHSITQNMGINGYSEAEETLQTALHLRQMLLSKTDIDTVWSSRYNDQIEVGLTERSTDANNRGASWYHSIHSNAGGATSNDVLLLWGELWDGTPDPPVGGEAMSDIMVDLLADVMRIPQNGWGSTGDCSFYSGWASTPCTQNGFQGPYLSVNRRTNMPSELSEQGHHTHPLQNQLDMNTDYCRMMAYSMFWTILDKFDLDRPYPGILAGIVTDSETGVRVNGATIEVNGLSYTTDTYESQFNQYSSDPNELHNGFYFFEGLPDSSYEVVVTVEGYYTDTLVVSEMSPDFVTFMDILLAPNTPPYIVESNPVEGDSLYGAWRNPSITFSRAMDEASVEAAFSIEPATAGSFYFTSSSKRMSFLVEDSLEFLTNYTITIAGTATDFSGNPIDGNQDTVGGDAWSLHFRTGPEDMSPPFVINSTPVNGSNTVNLRPIINLVWNEELDSASVTLDRIEFDRVSDSQAQPFSLEHHVINSKSVMTIYASSDLLDSEAYRVRLLPGFADLFGNTRTIETIMNFSTANYDFSSTSIDNFETSAVNYWWALLGSGSTTGVLPEITLRDFTTDLSVFTETDSISLQINYGWDTSADSWLIREYLGGGPGRNIHFNSNNIMQAWVFGDGNGNTFRFCVDDNIGGAGAHEVSPWYTVNWYGWKLVSWDMAVDGTGTWIGDGNLDGTLEFDSFQFGYTPGNNNIGTYHIDNLRVVDRNYLDIDETQLQQPAELALLPNYPNPFNPWTTIPFTLVESARATVTIYNLRGELVTTLISGHLGAGYHETRWNASDVSSGVYLIKLESKGVSQTRKIMVLK